MSDYAAAADTTSRPLKFALGTGAQLLSPILEDCLQTREELIIVTCFWAKSKSRDDVSHLLRKLSEEAISQDRKIRVRLCLSSVSIVQKLLQTSSKEGMVYIPSKWTNIGLPGPRELRGLDLVVKSIFVRPFSVMHPKFILMDRERAFMPSCNVSWEEWFEGCIEMEGEIAGALFRFWKGFWGRGRSAVPRELGNRVLPRRKSRNPEPSPSPPSSPTTEPPFINQATLSLTLTTPIRTLLLPSPHHRNPQFKLFGRRNPPPPTPLNAFLLETIATARRSISIQTPNLTCKPLISALFTALLLGTNVSILTSRRLMVLEQLVTAGTVTELEVWKLKRKYGFALRNHERAARRDPEAGYVAPGVLEIGYFRPRDGEGLAKSHLKLVVVDEEIVVLGSGNQDRASWYTSQELGIAFFSAEMAREIRACVDEGLHGRVEKVL